MKISNRELLEMVKAEARINQGADVEKIADSIIDRLGEENIPKLESFWGLLYSQTYTSMGCQTKFYGDCL